MSSGTKYENKIDLLASIISKVYTNTSFSVTADKIQTAMNDIIESLWDKTSPSSGTSKMILTLNPEESTTTSTIWGGATAADALLNFTKYLYLGWKYLLFNKTDHSVAWFNVARGRISNYSGGTLNFNLDYGVTNVSGVLKIQINIYNITSGQLLDGEGNIIYTNTLTIQPTIVNGYETVSLNDIEIEDFPSDEFLLVEIKRLPEGDTNSGYFRLFSLVIKEN